MSRSAWVYLLSAAPVLAVLPIRSLESQETATALRAGIIGLDTSHAVAFTRLLNAERPPPELAGCRVVAAYPQGSRDIASSVARVPQYTRDVAKLGVQIVGSIDQLLSMVDVVLLETNDGRPHFEQAIPVLRQHKPVFIDKPVAGSLADAMAIYRAAERLGTPIFSASALRFGRATQKVRGGSLGQVVGCDAYSPCPLEPTHPDLFWYGIHGVETLFTVMGPGCRSVRRTATPSTELVVGQWDAGRIGTFRGLRDPARSGYGGTAFGAQGSQAVGQYDGYEPLVVQIVQFFRTRKPPVSAAETLEIYAFMEAADESKRQGGGEVTLESVLSRAGKLAQQRVAGL